MRVFLALTALLLAAPCRSDPPAPDAAKVVAYAQAIDVARLDPALESRPLAEWLRLGPARLEKLQWRMSDCDLKPDYEEPAGGYPLCVRIGYQRDRVAGWMIVTVGSTRKGISGPPRFEYAVASAPSASGTMQFDRTEKLGELPKVLQRLEAR